MKCHKPSRRGAAFLFFSISSEALVSVGIARHLPSRESRVVWPQDSDLMLTALEGNVAFLECFLCWQTIRRHPPPLPREPRLS